MIFKNQLNKLFFFLFLISSRLLALFPSEHEIATICSQEGQPLKQFIKNGIVNNDFDVVSEFGKKYQILGQGSFASVKQVEIGKDKYVIKFSKCKNKEEFDSVLLEIELLRKMTEREAGVTPNIYACVYRGLADLQTNFLTEITEVYLVMSSLGRPIPDLYYDQTKYKGTRREYLKIIKDIVFGVKKLWDVGYVHVDLKPDNILYDEKDRKYKLIDFNLSGKNTDRKDARGTPGFVSVGLFRGSIPWEERDDLYSIAIIAAGMLRKGGNRNFLNQIWKSDSQFFRKDMNNSNKKIWIKALIKIFQTSGFGEFQTISTDQNVINFTTLMTMLILYDFKKWSFQEVIDILDRLIEQIGDEIIIPVKEVSPNLDYSSIFKIARQNCLKDFIIDPIYKKTGILIEANKLEIDGCRCKIGLDNPVCRYFPFYFKYENSSYRHVFKNLNAMENKSKAIPETKILYESQKNLKDRDTGNCLKFDCQIFII